jgi:hypothetical protein
MFNAPPSALKKRVRAEAARRPAAKLRDESTALHGRVAEIRERTKSDYMAPFRDHRCR